ncbi:DUF4145 domain-containing protein [Bacillus haynesii]|uniref:hypothetical protein n=1 Tax=Bacillus haynesii TaxID=1925021 RepID=UPI002DB871A3|nr:hypothetical protein [Bacillus haynesii]MEC1451552.1 DUF4145 domain-containing protein [Bacillus haynesii]
MRISKFASDVNLTKKTELEKVKLLAFFQNTSDGTTHFSLDNILNLLKDLGHPISNKSRLKNYLAKSKDFKKIGNSEYIISPAAKQKLKSEYGHLFEDSETIISSNEVLDENLFLDKRGFLDKLIKQINSCYSNNCYDACAVLMRRVFEISLILAFENRCIQDQIKDRNGDYLMLEKIVSNAVNNKKLNISRSKKEYESIRNLGNFAAHKIYFNTRKIDIDDIKQTYRVCLEELFYIAGLLK